MKRCVAHLHEVTPGTPPYTATIRAIRSLAELIGAPALDLIADEDAERVRSYGTPAPEKKPEEKPTPVVMPVTAEPAPEKPEETPRPVEKPEKTPADEPKSASDQPDDDLPTMADCRAELLKARKRGVKIQELLAQFGAKQFTSVKREDYEALMEAARNA
jgi:outer membrane biosynthesis protein TonB